MVDLERKIKETQRSETPTIKPSRYDPRGDLKPLFDDQLEQTPSSYSALKDDPVRFLRLVLSKSELIPATYKTIESHLHDYDIPIDVCNETLSKMPKALTKLNQVAEESISLIRSALDELNDNDNPSIPNTVSDRHTDQLAFVDSVSTEVMIKLNDVISSKKDPLLSVVNYSISKANDSNKKISPEISGLFVKDGRVSFFLLAYIDILVGWILASSVKSHPSPEVLFDYGVNFRLSGVRPVPTYWLSKNISPGIGVWKLTDNIDYLQFRDSIRLPFRLPDPLGKAIYFDLFDNSSGELDDFYDECDKQEASNDRKTIDAVNIYVPVYDLMYSSIRLAHKIKAHVLGSDKREDLLARGDVGLEDQESITDDNVDQLMNENVDLNVVMAEASNLTRLHDTHDSGYNTAYRNIYLRITKQVQRKLVEKGKTPNPHSQRSEDLHDELNGHGDHPDDLRAGVATRGVDANHTPDSEGSFLPGNEEIKSDESATAVGAYNGDPLEDSSFSSGGVSELMDKLVDYDFVDVKRAYIDAWSDFIYEVYGLAEETGYDPRVIEDHLHGYDPESVYKILDSFKSSPVKAYSVNGRLVDLLRLYHVVVYAPSRSEVLKSIILPVGEPATDEDFREFLKFYLIVNTGLGDARIFMNKLSNSMFGEKDPYALSGDYSSGKGGKLICMMNDPLPLNVVHDCGGFEWLDISRLEGFLSLMEENPDWRAFPEDYVLETIYMESSR